MATRGGLPRAQTAAQLVSGPPLGEMPPKVARQPGLGIETALSLSSLLDLDRRLAEPGPGVPGRHGLDGSCRPEDGGSPSRSRREQGGSRNMAHLTIRLDAPHS